MQGNLDDAALVQVIRGEVGHTGAGDGMSN